MLTGKTRYRATWLGKLILQVEEKYKDIDYFGSHVEVVTRIRWRDARPQDLGDFNDKRS